MKRFLILQVLLIILFSGYVRAQERNKDGEFKMIGDYENYSRDNNTLDFQCSNGFVRLEICTDDIFRIRMCPTKDFKPNKPGQDLFHVLRLN